MQVVVGLSPFPTAIQKRAPWTAVMMLHHAVHDTHG